MDATIDAARWHDVQTRNRAADETFVYGVRTTGIYCRPSCRSRPALRRNVRFYPDADAAEAAGLRPCRRCDPRRLRPTPDAVVAAACRLIERSETLPTLAALAREAGFSPGHFHLVFKRATGLTPRGYASARRAERLRAALSHAASVTAAFYAAGFNAASRFYVAAPALLGMKPARYRRGGAGLDIHYACAPCSLGLVLAAATAQGICAISLGDDAAGLTQALQLRLPAARLRPAPACFAATLRAVVALIEQPGTGLALPLDIRGTVFQHRVWQALRAVPVGRTVSYGDLAAAIGAPGASRAVARACAANPVAVAVPCHRAVAADGALTGYRWGIARKGALLGRERGD